MNREQLSRETPLVFSEVPKRLPKRHGKKVHYSTVYRWATKGVRGRVLETVRVGGVRYTSIEALERFLTAQTPTDIEAPKSAELDDELTAIQRHLDEAGL